ncbi:MAG TPA: HEAT repeat domain-containing protein [Pyrinomonadaceae bacterium]|nr:HEAT repeat domain-containing protein [Pyrinomonadaceae bacterium]
MLNSKPISSLILSVLSVLALAGVACAKHSPDLTVVAEARDDLQAQSTATTVQSFTPVDGADLMAKLDAAQARGRSGQTPYWSAYTFDVRPGVAIDPTGREFSGSMQTIGDTTVFVGTTAGGVTVETRNVAIFLLREPSANQITRMEIYNLERKREYSGYPVYWMGRANNEESLNYLRALAGASPLDMLSERAVLGIALHDDARVGGMLKNFISSSTNQRIRSSSVYWLGQVGGEQTFLATLVRNDAEEKKLRRSAAHAIGQSKDRGSVETLKGLYDSVKDVEVRRSVISAVGNSIYEQQQAYTFLLSVAKSDADWESRRSATRQLGNFQREDAVDELMKIYANDAQLDVKRTALRALSETKNARAQARLLELARTEPNAELRKSAIRMIGERGEAAVDDLLKLYDSEQTPDLKRAVLQSLSEIKSTRVEDKLFEVARSSESTDVRRHAIRLLGERVSKRSFDFLSQTAQAADGTTEVQVQAVRAISERRSEESVPILIKIARTHQNQLVRKQAIRSLGESGDPRAVEFFREVLTK